MTKKKTTNIKAFKALMKKYKAITLEDMKRYMSYSHNYPLTNVTGFGDVNTCCLCIEATRIAELSYKTRCLECVWCDYTGTTYLGCFGGFNKTTTTLRRKRAKAVGITYDILRNSQGAGTPRKLFNALQKRIAIMEEAIKEYDNEDAI